MATYTWGASGAPPDPPWTSIRAGLSQSTGTLVSTSSFGIVQYNAASFGLAHYCQAVWKIDSSLIFNGQQMLMVRAADIDNYVVANFDDGRHNVTLTSRIAGTQVLLYTVAVPSAFAANDVIKVDITSAGLITLYRNGTSFGSYDAAAINATLTGTSVDVSMSGASSDQGAWGDWTGAALTSAAPLRRNSTLNGLGASGPFFNNPLG